MNFQSLHFVAALCALTACVSRPVEETASTGSETTPTDTTGTGGPAVTTGAPTSTGDESTAGLLSSSSASESTTTGESTSGSEGAEVSSEPGCGFLCPPDGGGQEALLCDPQVQDCPMGQKCVWWQVPGSTSRRDGTRCIEVTGDGAPFEPCSLPTGLGEDITDDCGADSFCLEVYLSADHGFCAPFPLDDNDCSHHPGTVYATENGSIFPHACLHYECNPQVAESCPDGLGCAFYPAFLYGTNMCWQLPADDLPVGSACDYGQCGAGKLCLDAPFVPGCANERCCTEWCDLSAPDCSNAAASCDDFPVWNEDDPSFATLGACVIPGSLMP